jgi:hypothetical protein
MTDGSLVSTTCSVIKFISADPSRTPKIFADVNDEACQTSLIRAFSQDGSSVVISGTTTDSTDRCEVLLSAGDQLGPKDGSEVKFTAYARSAASVLRTPSSVSVTEGSPVSFIVSTRSLVRSETDPITVAEYSCELATSPYGEAKTCTEVSATINAATGVFSWTPSTESEGLWTFRLASRFPHSPKNFATVKVGVKDSDPPPSLYLTLPQPGRRIPVSQSDISRWPIAGRCSEPGATVVIAGIVTAEAICRPGGTFSVNADLTSFDVSAAVAGTNPAPFSVSISKEKFTATYSWSNIFHADNPSVPPPAAASPTVVQEGGSLACEPQRTNARNQLYFLSEWTGVSGDAAKSQGGKSRYVLGVNELASSIGCRYAVMGSLVGTVLKNRSEAQVGRVDPGATLASSAMTISATEGVAFQGNFPAATGPTSGSNLTWSIVTQATHGEATVTGNSTRAFSYVPNPNFHGSDSFTFRVCDDGTTPLCSPSYSASVAVAQGGSSVTIPYFAAAAASFTGQPGDFSFSSIKTFSHKFLLQKHTGGL